jgi:Ca2+-binding EF-hand superfamily protein
MREAAAERADMSEDGWPSEAIESHACEGQLTVGNRHCSKESHLSDARFDSAVSTRRASREAPNSEVADHLPDGSDGSMQDAPHRIGFRESKEMSTEEMSQAESDGGAVSSRPTFNRAATTRVFDPAKLNFQTAVVLAKKHCMSVEHVRDQMELFVAFGPNAEGFIEMDQFKEMLRSISGVAPGEDLPEHLLSKHFLEMDQDGNGGIDFEEFIVWHFSAGYTEEMLVADANERLLRQISRDHGIPLTDIEKINKTFREFDADSSGSIDRDEFRHVLTQLMNVKDPRHMSEQMFTRLWREVDRDASGTINFEEFATWYFFLFYTG